MAKLLVAGLINIETTLQVSDFPVHYEPMRYPFFGVNTTVSGVGYNLARALSTLGDSVQFMSLVGRDLMAKLVYEALERDGIPAEGVIGALDQTCQSVILFDKAGQRMGNADLKNIQEAIYPPERFEAALKTCDAAALCNINFSRRYLDIARRMGKLIATDVHTISSLEDDYNQDYMRRADVLFMSDSRLPTTPEDWAKALLERFANLRIAVIGLGERGALLAVRSDNFVGRFPVIQTRSVVNTIGAGDALFSAFLHNYVRTWNPYTALQKAQLFASWKVGANGGAEGFLDEAALETLYNRTHS